MQPLFEEAQDLTVSGSPKKFSLNIRIDNEKENKNTKDVNYNINDKRFLYNISLSIATKGQVLLVQLVPNLLQRSKVYIFLLYKNDNNAGSRIGQIVKILLSNNNFSTFLCKLYTYVYKIMYLLPQCLYCNNYFEILKHTFFIINKLIYFYYITIG